MARARICFPVMHLPQDIAFRAENSSHAALADAPLAALAGCRSNSRDKAVREPTVKYWHPKLLFGLPMLGQRSVIEMLDSPCSKTGQPAYVSCFLPGVLHSSSCRDCSMLSGRALQSSGKLLQALLKSSCHCTGQLQSPPLVQALLTSPIRCLCTGPLHPSEVMVDDSPIGIATPVTKRVR